MEAMCPRFMGFTEPTYVEDIKAYLIPYGSELEALKNIPYGTQWIGGHWAAENAGFPGEHVPLVDLPTDIPTLLGHYHTRQIATNHIATYTGATERFAWGEANNPTGVAVFDTDTKQLDFIDHETREWVDVTTHVERVLDDLRGRDLEGKIVRVSVEATVPEYHGLDIKSVRDTARGALEFQIRRVGSAETLVVEHQDTQTYSLLDAWQQHTAGLKPAEMRKAVQGLGERALSAAGVGE
jgi:DNA repair exonuclease SbcCD nuclease subunit